MIQALRATLLLATLSASAVSFAGPVVFNCTTVSNFPYINRFTATGTVVVDDDHKVTGAVTASYVQQADKNPGSLASTVTGRSFTYAAGVLGPKETEYLNLQLGDNKDNRLMISLDGVSTYPSRLKLGNVFYRANCATVAGDQK